MASRSPSSPTSNSAADWTWTSFPRELTYGLGALGGVYPKTLRAFYDIRWNDQWTYADVRLADEEQYSAYNFEEADVSFVWDEFNLHEAECKRLLERLCERTSAFGTSAFSAAGRV